MSDSRHLLIVSRERIGLYDVVRRSAPANIEVRLDQRLSERRVRFLTVPADRRRADRRRNDVSGPLQRLGWVLIPATQRS